MPTYDYQCPNCECRFELRQGFDDRPIADCPRCHATAHRVFSPVPILFKGSGFYITDSKAGQKREDEAVDTKAKEESPAAGAES